ncbi:hypothetical protein Mapa_009659 [Marchantia paleacea]|nr:hypothetical protein Mapa_009659 [Marchantia paleacea]
MWTLRISNTRKLDKLPLMMAFASSLTPLSPIGLNDKSMISSRGKARIWRALTRATTPSAPGSLLPRSNSVTSSKFSRIWDSTSLAESSVQHLKVARSTELVDARHDMVVEQCPRESSRIGLGLRRALEDKGAP